MELQLILNLSDSEMQYLDLKFIFSPNVTFCGLVKTIPSAATCLLVTLQLPLLNMLPILVQLLKLDVYGVYSILRQWYYFKAFNNLCQSSYLSEPTMQQLVDCFCKPVLLCNVIAVNLI